MTTINSQDDFLRALEENPQWRDAIRRHILTEELLQLPARFHVLTQRVDTLDQKVDVLTQRVNTLDQKVDVLTQRVNTLDQKVDVLTQRVNTLDQKVDVLTQSMSQVKTDLNTLTGRVDNLTGRVDNLTDRIDNAVNTLTDRINNAVNMLTGRVDNALGYNYQLKVERNLRSIAGQHLHLRNIAILRSSRPDWSNEFDNLIQEAVDQGLITEEQSYEVWDTDLIFVGTPRGDTTPIYVAAEVSITAGDDDITRAANRAGLIAQATRRPVTPVVICANVDDPRHALATRHNATVIPHPAP